MFEFHNFFDGLIGYETLRKLKADILTTENQLKFPTGIINMYRKYPDSAVLQLNCNETRVVNLPTDMNNGEFYLEDDIFLSSEVVVHAGVYSCSDSRVFVPVTNISNEPTKIVVNDPLAVELNNFDTDVEIPEIYNESKGRIFDQLRLDHLNNEEKINLMKVIADYEKIFL